MYLCIYVAILLSIYTQYILTGCTWYMRAARGMPEDCDQLIIEMDLEAESKRVWRCTYMLRLSTLSDALGGCNRTSLEMLVEAQIEQTRTSTLKP